MSAAELYTRTAPHYDRTRAAVGVEIILGCLAAGGELHRQTVVDAGCGTGNYARALSPHVGVVHAVDRSEAMLVQARAKAGGGVVFHRAGVDSLPVGDGAADGVTVNQVLHHL
ncbi:MAG: methyltransferase domain-containing protein, partial [Gammaproteobacteria bacterium]|nr:methyltransferase domain-containing protein [Gammaproteobacteria bacterium]